MEIQRAQNTNKEMYEELYSKQQAFLRYPGDWIPRFHNMYLKEHLPSGRVLDYSCGSGNNSIFFIRNGYDVYGVDVAEPVHDLIRMNLQSYSLDLKYVERFKIIPLDWTRLPFEDNFFDFILSNQVLYYLGSEAEIKRVCREFSRCLRPGGIVFFTMMGPKNYYIVYHSKQIHDGKVYEIRIEDPTHRLHGLYEMIYLVRDEDELKALFSEFDCITTGHTDQSMFDMSSNFHWIFVGGKRA
jgi:SAM-dependent methyltransferase